MLDKMNSMLVSRSWNLEDREKERMAAHHRDLDIRLDKVEPSIIDQLIRRSQESLIFIALIGKGFRTGKMRNGNLGDGSLGFLRGGAEAAV